MKVTGIVLYLIILSIYDIRLRKVPAGWLAAGTLAALCTIIWSVCGVAEVSGNWQEFWPALWQEIGQRLLFSWMPGLVMLGACLITGRVGSADGWVLLIVGILISNGQLLAAFGCSMILIALAAGVLLLLKKVGRNDCLPYLPFFTVAVILVQL